MHLFEADPDFDDDGKTRAMTDSIGTVGIGLDG